MNDHVAEPFRSILNAQIRENRSEPIEGLPRPVRQRDLIQHRAMVKALHSVSQVAPELDFGTVSYIIEQYEASVAEQHLERQYEYEQKRGGK